MDFFSICKDWQLYKQQLLRRSCCCGMWCQKLCNECICLNQPARPCRYGIESGSSLPPAPSAVSCTLPSTDAQPPGPWFSIHLWSSCSPGVMPLSPSSLLALDSGSMRVNLYKCIFFLYNVNQCFLTMKPNPESTLLLLALALVFQLFTF